MQSRVQDCEGFSQQLDSLTLLAQEAEQVLKESDPLGSPELPVLQERMEKLKVNMGDLLNPNRPPPLQPKQPSLW